MFIITNKENVIKAISSKYELDEKHRNIILDGYNIAYAPDEVYNSYEYNEEIENDIQTEKYCYTEEKGFYLNENYEEPQRPVTMEELMEQITDLQLALAEIVEGGNA